jgi:hypothetical protein
LFPTATGIVTPLLIFSAKFTIQPSGVPIGASAGIKFFSYNTAPKPTETLMALIPANCSLLAI